MPESLKHFNGCERDALSGKVRDMKFINKMCFAIGLKSRGSQRHNHVDRRSEWFLRLRRFCVFFATGRSTKEMQKAAALPHRGWLPVKRVVEIDA